MSNYKGIEYLRRKLNRKRERVNLRYEYYEMKNLTKDFNISTPPTLKNWMSTAGWCGKAVDSLADRIVFREFENDNFQMNEIFQMNNPDVLTDSAFLSALISSCSFIYLAPDQDGFPRMAVIDGGNATGEIDPVTNMLNEGYAVLQRDDRGIPTQEAYFVPYRTVYYTKGKPGYRVLDHDAPYPLLVPVIYRPDARRPFGHSRISRACMSYVGSAIRTIKRSEISAEFFSYPQRWATGVDDPGDIKDKWQAVMSQMFTIGKSEDGNNPSFGQFQQQSMQPHNDQLKMFASLFAGECGLTVDDLGFTTDNPASSDAIKASHENLRLTARKAQRTFGTGLLNAGYLAACIRDKFTYQRRAIYMTEPKWEPIFEPDASALTGFGDAAIKLQQAFPDYFTESKLRDLTGI